MLEAGDIFFLLLLTDSLGLCLVIPTRKTKLKSTTKK